MQRNLLLLTAAVALAGCSTELDINAPYEENTVVYGLLNMRDSVHFVKVNKAFLGEGNAFDFALVPDSNEYSGEAISFAKVYRLGTNGLPVDSFPLMDTLVSGREPGTFFAPDQRMFYFRTPEPALNQSGGPQITSGRTFLYQNAQYRLDLVVKGRKITSTTNIASDFSIQATDQDTVNNAAQVNFMNPTGTGYGAYEFNWTSSGTGKRYVLTMDFKYDEVRDSGTERKVISQKFPAVVATTTAQQMAMTVGGEAFYNTLRTVIPVDASVQRRIFRGIDFRMAVANDALHTYLTLDEPVSGIIEDRPAFSNIDGAFGVWASRYTKTVQNKRLNATSLNELINGSITGNLGFCSGFNVGPPYGCD